jgi:restriction system protein
MATTDRTLWGIHAGRSGEVDELFLKQRLLGLGWSQIGDLSKLAADRTAFKAKVREAFPKAKDGAINNWAGQLFRFVHEMKPGDFVAYPSKNDRQIHLGKVEGPYRYDPAIAPKYFNVRDVKWLKAFPRSHFTQGALYEIGSALSLFQIKNYADEYFTAMEGKAAPAPVQEDESVPAVGGEIEENTQAWIIGRLAQETKGHPFAHFVGHLLNVMGYHTRISPEGPDGGVDIVAHKDELGFEPPIIKVQCKATEGGIGDPVVSALYGKVGTGEFGLFVTLGTFTTPAVTFAKSRHNLRLIDGNELVELIYQHYERFDARYKGLLPMRRVYVPEPIEENGE